MKKVLLFFCLFCINNIIFAQPGNDGCNGAIDIPLLEECTSGAATIATNAGATDSDSNNEVTSHACGNYLGGDVYYSFVASASTTANIITYSVAGSNVNDTAIEVYDACGGISLGCDDDINVGVNNFSSLDLTGLTPGQTYYIAAWTYGGTPTGEFGICVWDPVPPPPNNDMCGAIPISCESVIDGSTVNATGSGDTECGNSHGNNTWYQFTGDGSILSMIAYSDDNSGVQIDVVITDDNTCDGELICIDWSQNFNGTTSLDIPTSSGLNYYISISRFGGGADIDFTLEINCFTLAIELASFEATAMDIHNLITWTTSSEVNNDYFAVERSQDGITSWEQIGSLISGENNSFSTDYSLIDENPYLKSYYRLKSVDFNGKEEFSNIVPVKRKFDVEIKVYPNPFAETITIQIPLEGDVCLTISDHTGKIVSLVDRHVDGNSFTHNLSKLPTGSYQIGIMIGAERLNQRIIKID